MARSQRCADLDRDPAEITCSTIARGTGDIGAFLTDVDRWNEVDVDLVIVVMSPTLPAAAIDDVAAALATR